MVERLKLLPRYLINIGFLKGLFVFFQVELLSLSRIILPGYQAPVFLRKNTSDRRVFREIFLFRLYGFGMSISPKVIVDGGANIGLSSVYFANRFKDATVYAVEPEGTNLDALRKNVSAYPQVKALASALWHSDTFLRIKNLNESKWAFSVEECLEQEPNSIKGISITTLMNERGIEKIDLLKLDIESSEKELFQYKADEWLPRIKTMVIELHDWMKPGCSTSFFAAIAGYRVSVTIHEGMLVVNNNEVK